MRKDKEAADLLCLLLGVLWILLQIYSIRNLSVVQYFRQIRFKEKKNTQKKIVISLAAKCNLQINHHAFLLIIEDNCDCVCRGY